METIEVPVDRLMEASWNPNQMDRSMESRLEESLRKYGNLSNLVARKIDTDSYEVLSGNHRLRVMRRRGFTHIPCVIVELDDSHARLLAQALNRVHGEDDLGLKAEVVREVLSRVSNVEVLSILPETAQSLQDLEHLGEMDLTEHLRAWNAAQKARSRHLIIQLTDPQLETVNRALTHAMAKPEAQSAGSNQRGGAFYAICAAYLNMEGVQ